MSVKTRSKTRSSRRRVANALERTQKALAKKREENPVTDKPEPKSGDRSHKRPQSKKELAYQPHRSKGTKFIDPNRRAYEVSDQGELRAINKPRSRVKRLREEEEAKAKKSE